jgi:dynein heavy chain, axonemal
LTLQKLFDLEVQQKASDLIEISTRALQERNLKETLGQVDKTLAETDMVIKPYKEGGYVLGGVDELTIILDESLANVNNTLANRYIKPLKKGAEKQSQDIQLIMEIVEKWV